MPQLARVTPAAWGFTLILLLSLALRFVRLGSFPPDLLADEADNLTTVYTILYQHYPSVFGLDWKPSPAFSMYISSAFVSIFNNDALGLRFSSAAFSTLALVPLYALYSQWVSRPAALISLLLLSTSVWYLNFSRNGWENVNVVLVTAAAAWCVVRALETREWRFWALAGAASAAGLYSYFAGRAVLPALLGYAAFAAWSTRDRARTLAGFALLAGVAVSLFIPQLPSIAQNPQQFNRRAERVSVLQASSDYLGHRGAPEVLAYQVWRNARFFFDGSVLDGPAYSPPEQRLTDTRPRYSPFGKPLLAPLTAALFLLGMIVCALRRKAALWWLMLLVPWVLTQVLTTNSPDAARGIGMLPAVYFFVAAGADQLWRLRVGRCVRPALLAGAAVTALFTATGYFQWAASGPALAARQPSVSLAELPAWRAAQVDRVSRGYPPLTVTQWQQTQEERPYR